MFDGVTRLANSYLNIGNAGSILFRDLTFTFYCDKYKNNTTVVNIGDSFRKDSLCENVEDEIMEMSKFMESCYEEWTDHISSKRNEFYFLNHFSISQLVILREEVMVTIFYEQEHFEIDLIVFHQLKNHVRHEGKMSVSLMPGKIYCTYMYKTICREHVGLYISSVDQYMYIFAALIMA